MVIGNCHLCGQLAELVDSHVWSRFGYKRYVSDLSKGGTFLDLAKKQVSNSQYQRPWFCDPCDRIVIGQTEDYAARICDAFEKRQSDPQTYDDRLLRFAVSISWRTAKLYGEREPKDLAEVVRPACRHWKDYLRDKKSNVGPYSQHVFVVFDPTVGMHRALGGQVFPEESLVLSQIGPLQIVALLRRDHLSSSERKIWEQSQLSPAGGTITPITEWRVHASITMNLARLKCQHEANVKRQVIELAHKPTSKRTSPTQSRGRR